MSQGKNRPSVHAKTQNFQQSSKIALFYTYIPLIYINIINILKKHIFVSKTTHLRPWTVIWTVHEHPFSSIITHTCYLDFFGFTLDGPRSKVFLTNFTLDRPRQKCVTVDRGVDFFYPILAKFIMTIKITNLMFLAKCDILDLINGETK